MVVYFQVRGLVEQTQEWESLYSCAARDNIQVLPLTAASISTSMCLTVFLLYSSLSLFVALVPQCRS